MVTGQYRRIYHFPTLVGETPYNAVWILKRSLFLFPLSQILRYIPTDKSFLDYP